MPGVAVYFGALYVLEEIRLEQLAEMRADDDGMAQPYITLKGIKERRMLSWAEERALRKNLEDRGASRLYLATRIHVADEAGYICADKVLPWSAIVLGIPQPAQFEKPIGQQYAEAIARSRRDTKHWLTIHVLDGWTTEQHRHWVNTGEEP